MILIYDCEYKCESCKLCGKCSKQEEFKITIVYGLELSKIKMMIDYFVKKGINPYDKDFEKQLEVN